MFRKSLLFALVVIAALSVVSCDRRARKLQLTLTNVKKFVEKSKKNGA